MSKNVLIVEDNEHNYDMLSRRLRRRNYEVTTAVDGKEGVDKAKTERPDIILMDINLPVMDGLEATRQIRDTPELESVPIIALTAKAMSDDRKKTLEAGCDEYHAKPVDLPKLLAQMEELFQEGASSRYSN